MRIRSNGLVLVLSLALASCAAEPVDEGLTPAAVAGLAVRLDATSTTFSAAETPWVELTYTNATSQPIQLLAWAVPSEDLWEDLFSVRLGDRQAPYIGRVYRRPEPPRERDLVTLEPGQSIRGRVDLSRLYDLPESGEYQVQLRADVARFMPRATGLIVSNRLQIFSEGRQRALRADQLETQYYGISYVSCSGSQKQDLVAGMEWADWAANDAADFMNNTPPGNQARYKKWFGSYSSSRWSKVKSVFNTLLSRVNNKRMRLHCDCYDDYYAYVYPDQPYNIYVCNVYWDASIEDKGGTFIHELTHFYAVGGTDDVIYGSSSCRSLARNNPNDAVRNADNYAYFVEEP